MKPNRRIVHLNENYWCSSSGNITWIIENRDGLARCHSDDIVSFLKINFESEFWAEKLKIQGENGCYQSILSIDLYFHFPIKSSETFHVNLAVNPPLPSTTSLFSVDEHKKAFSPPTDLCCPPHEFMHLSVTTKASNDLRQCHRRLIETANQLQKRLNDAT